MLKTRAYKLRFRRRFRVQKRQVEEFGAQAEQHLENKFFKRLERLVHVRRFVSSWLLLLLLLIGGLIAQNRSLSSYYQAPLPVPGGTYTEGVLGSFTNANPIYATDLVNATVSKLVFSSLFKYDETNQLVGDLAESWSTNDRGTVYAVTLKPNLTWHDGRPLTSADVVFTYQVIQNPDARSPLFNSWQGVTVAATDERTVTFTLPNSLASFPHSLTTGIVPKHLLDGVVMADMRTIPFNTANPVGSGPFMWQAIQVTGGTAENREENIALRAFPDYHEGTPKLSSFVVHAFRNSQALISAFQNKQVNAIVGLAEVPEQLKDVSFVRTYNMPLTAQVMTFFRTGFPLFQDARIRHALVAASDVPAVMDNLPYATTAVREPLLQSQLGYDPTYRQPGYDPARAAALLDEAGWLLAQDGFRYNGSTRLSFILSTQASGEYGKVAERLRQQWRAVGFDVTIDQAPDDITFQNTLAFHSYDALLYGISVGTDPDVFVYWHSSQADVLAPVRLNFSEYRSAVADSALESGRTRGDPALRAIKYQPFLQAWRDDAPALGLYQPRLLYIASSTVFGLSEHDLNADSDRLNNVQNWMFRTSYQTPERPN